MPEIINMAEKDIEKIYKMLNWENPPSIRLEGARLAREVHDLSLLIQPPAPPSVWEYCAEILSEKSDVALEPYLDKLLEWLQDINWPGAFTIANRLKIFSGEKLKQSLENAIAESNKMPNEERLRWIDYLSELLDNKELICNLSEEVLILLKKHYRNWGYWYSE